LKRRPADGRTIGVDLPPGGGYKERNVQTSKLTALLSAALAAGELCSLAAERPQKWLEVTSPHFVVVTNATEKAGRRVADEFERIRSVFHAALPKLRLDPGVPIIILAVKDEATFRELEPSDWKRKGQLQRAGMFLSGEEKNYVLSRLDVESAERDRIIYHEYTHLLLHLNLSSLPLWLDEGLAEFYGNSEIRDKEVLLGKPAPDHERILMSGKLLPLETLFAVDHSSPYYNEQNRGTLFYAESWAVTHYLVMTGFKQGKPLLSEFLGNLARGVDATTAATAAFGSLTQLEAKIPDYIRQYSLNVFKMKAQTEKEADTFSVRELPQAECDARRGDFLVDAQAYPEGKALLDKALKADPRLALAHESMGMLELRASHQAEAKRWFGQAVALNSQSYLANYYFAVMSLQSSPAESSSTQVESSLRAAIKINPLFAPAHATLATLYIMRGENLEEAHTLALRAVELEPSNVHNHLTVGSVLLRMKKADDAVKVGERARGLAKSPEEKAAVDSFLESARQFQQHLASVKSIDDDQAKTGEERQQVFVRRTDDAGGANPQVREQFEPPMRPESPAQEKTPGPLQHRDEQVTVPPESEPPTVPPPVPPPHVSPQPAKPQPPRAPIRIAVASGRVASVVCTQGKGIEVTLDFGTRKLVLLMMSEFRLTVGGVAGSFNVCQYLQGKWVRVTYRVIQSKTTEGEVVSLQLQQ